MPWSYAAITCRNVRLKPHVKDKPRNYRISYPSARFSFLFLFLRKPRIRSPQDNRRFNIAFDSRLKYLSDKSSRLFLCERAASRANCFSPFAWRASRNKFSTMRDEVNSVAVRRSRVIAWNVNRNVVLFQHCWHERWVTDRIFLKIKDRNPFKFRFSEALCRNYADSPENSWIAISNFYSSPHRLTSH